MKSNKHVVYDCKYHIVWCPKYRKPLLVAGVDVRLKEIILEVSKDLGAEVLEMDVMPDHVHLLIECDPQFGIHRVIKKIKGVSSRLLRREFKPCRTRVPTLWSHSYFVSTVGGAPLSAVKAYIEGQKG